MDLIAILLYAVLGFLYLLAVPLGIYLYLQQRWYVASSFERAFMYFLMFFFFPGMIVWGPFLNFRPQRRQVGS